MEKPKRERTEINVDFNSKNMGERIAFERERLKKKQNVLAEEVGLSNVHMSKIETGRHGLSFFAFVKICQVLNVNPDYLISGNIRTNNVSKEIYENLSFCTDEQIDTIACLVEQLIRKNKKSN